VERFILSAKWKNTTKNNFFQPYKHYYEANEITWMRLFLKPQRYLVKAPTEERIKLIISSATPHYATMFHLSRMGLKPDEVSKITLRDLDLERRELLVRTSKLGLERNLRMSQESPSSTSGKSVRNTRNTSRRLTLTSQSQ
jgi:integrase